MATVDVDVVVDNVRFDTKIAGYQIDIDYDDSIVTPTGVVDVDARGSNAPNDVTIISRINSTGAPGLTALSDLITTADSMTVAAADGTSDAFFHIVGVQGVPQMHEPSAAGNGIDDDDDGDTDDAEETSGDGVVARITLMGVLAGVSPLTIPSTIGGADLAPDLTIVDGSGSDATPGDSVTVETTGSAIVIVGSPARRLSTLRRPTSPPARTCWAAASSARRSRFWSAPPC